MKGTLQIYFALQKDVKKAQEEEKKVATDFGGANLDVEETQAKLKEYNLMHQYQNMFQRQYKHMLDRMKKDLIALQLTINDLQESLRSKKTIYDQEYKAQMAARQEKLQSKFKLDKLMKNIDNENVKRQERIESLQKSIINKQ